MGCCHSSHTVQNSDNFNANLEAEGPNREEYLEHRIGGEQVWIPAANDLIQKADVAKLPAGTGKSHGEEKGVFGVVALLFVAWQLNLF